MLSRGAFLVSRPFAESAARCNDQAPSVFTNVSLEYLENRVSVLTRSRSRSPLVCVSFSTSDGRRWERGLETAFSGPDRVWFRRHGPLPDSFVANRATCLY